MPYRCWTHFGVTPSSHDKGATAEVWFPAGTNFAGELKTGSPMRLGDGKLQTNVSPSRNAVRRTGADHLRNCWMDNIKVILERGRDRIFQGANDTLPASVMDKSGKGSIKKFSRLRHGRLETDPVSERRQNCSFETIGRQPLVDRSDSLRLRSHEGADLMSAASSSYLRPSI